MDTLIALLSDPATWLALLTLIALEVVLGVDNLIFIAILSDKLPPAQRDRARLIGLSLALLMRLGLLASTFGWTVMTQADTLIAARQLSASDLGLYAEALFLTTLIATKFVPPLNAGAFPA